MGGRNVGAEPPRNGGGPAMDSNVDEGVVGVLLEPDDVFRSDHNVCEGHVVVGAVPS